MNKFFIEFKNVVVENKIGKLLSSCLEEDVCKEKLQDLSLKMVVARLALKEAEKDFWIAVRGAVDLLPCEFAFLFLSFDTQKVFEEQASFRTFSNQPANRENIIAYGESYMAYSGELLKAIEKIELWEQARDQIL